MTHMKNMKNIPVHFTGKFKILQDGLIGYNNNLPEIQRDIGLHKTKLCMALLTNKKL